MYKPPIKGKATPKQLKIVTRDPSSRFGITGLVADLKETKDEIIQTVDTQLQRIDDAVSTVTTYLDGRVDAYEKSIASLENKAVQMLNHVKNITQGPPGESPDLHAIITEVLQHVPDENTIIKKTLSQVPKIDEDALTRKILSKIPQDKPDLKIIQEKIEIDPMSVIDKIMALPMEKLKKFKLRSENIDGLDQTISAFNNQLGKGYLHGGGASILSQLNDVSLGSLTNGQVLTYNSVTGKWYNGAAGAGSGTVTSVSVVSANGFNGSVATATTTPAITLTTTITGLLKGNATAISAAAAGTDYQAPITLTTTGTSGAATFSANTLNIPQYSGGGITWNAVTTNGTFTVNTGVLANKGTLLTMALPTTSAVGDVIAIAGMNPGLWKISQAASQQIHFGNQNTTSGTGGSIASVLTYDAIYLVCLVANLEWMQINSSGNLTVT